MVVTIGSHHKNLGICAIAGLENVRNGIKLTNHTEYFPGHAEMDRAFGYGLEWDNGTKASMVPETPEPKEAS
jgi:tellurite resistance protein TerA